MPAFNYPFGNLDAWTFKPGNSTEIIYFTGVHARNPSGSTANVDTINFKTDGDTKFYQELTYNSADLCINVECKN